MRYRQIVVDAGRLNAMLRDLVPDLPPDARVCRAAITCRDGLLLTLYSERFQMVGLLERTPRLETER